MYGKIKKIICIFICLIHLLSGTSLVLASDEISINYSNLKPVVATSTKDETVFNCSFINDGNLLSRWEPQNLPASVTVDLETVVDIDEICIFTTEQINQYSVSVSNDGESWTAIASEEQGIIEAQDFASSIEVQGQGRYVKLEITEADNADKFGIYELEVRHIQQTNQSDADGKDEGSSSESSNELIPLYKTYPVDVSENRNKIIHLNNLGIISSFEDLSFRPNVEVSRSQFVTAVMHMLGREGIDTAESAFSDVSVSSRDYPFINAAYLLGLINGNEQGLFEPDKSIQSAEAMKILVRALGYEYLGETKGGYPAGYLQAANEIKLLRGVNITNGKILSRYDMANLIFNALNIQIYSQSSFADNVVQLTQSGTLLESVFDAELKTGIIVADGITSLSYSAKARKPHLTIDGNEYLCSLQSPAIYAGNMVEYICVDTEVISLADDEKHSIRQSIAYDDIVSLDTDAVIYSKESKSDASISFSNNFKVVYNGIVQQSYSFNDLFPEYGHLECIDWEGDGRVDILWIWDAINLAAGIVNKNEGIIIDKNNRNLVLNIAKYEDKFDLVKNDISITYQDISADSVLTIYADKFVEINGKRFIDFDKFSYCKISVTSEKVAGTITELDQSVNFITIDGTTYESTGSIEQNVRKVGSSGIFYVDCYGRICMSDDAQLEREAFGFLVSIDLPKGLQTPRAKVFMESGLQILDVSEKLYINEVKVTDYRKKMLESGLIDGDGKTVPQLIKLKVDANNGLKQIYTAQSYVGDFSMDYDSKEEPKQFFKDTRSFQDFICTSDALIFTVPKFPEKADDTETEYKINTISSLTNKAKYYVQAFNMDDLKRAPLVVIYTTVGSGISIEENSPVYVMSKITNALKEDGEVYPKVTFSGSNDKTAFVKDNSLKNVINSLSVGDIVQISVDANDFLNGINVIFRHLQPTTADEPTKYLGIYFGKILNADEDMILLDGTSYGLANVKPMVFSPKRAIFSIFNMDNQTYRLGSMSDVLSATDNDAVFIRCDVSVPEEVIIYKNYFN